MEYQACLDYMNRNCVSGTPGGYMRTQRMAELVGDPQEKLQIVHIAGTNGKGSTAAVMEAILRQAGYRVGLFTSPHLERYEERIQVDRQMISEPELAILLTMLIEQVIPQLLAEGMGHPGEFELLTVAGWMYFAGRTDLVILEVGLGGTLDPTNIIEHPLLTVITPVSLDHCAILGNTVAQIAREKAGILKEQVPAVIAPQQPEALAVLQETASELQVPLTLVQQENLQPVFTNLQGTYQQINCNTALEAVHNLQHRGLITITADQIAAGLQQVFWPGRMEYLDLDGQRGILLDGAHNPAGMACLAENLKTLYADREIILFLSILDDKEQIVMLQEILPLVSTVIVTRPEHGQRAQRWKQLQQEIRQLAPDCSCQLYEQYQEGLMAALKRLQPGQLLCITGSLYLLGDCRRFLHTVLS